MDNIFQKRFIEKLRLLKETENISYAIGKLENMLPYTHRIRIGNMRVLLKQSEEDESIFYILDFGKRGDIYK